MTIDTRLSDVNRLISTQLSKLRNAIAEQKEGSRQVDLIQIQRLKHLPDFSAKTATPIINFINTHNPECQELDKLLSEVGPLKRRKGDIFYAVSLLNHHLSTHLDGETLVGTVQQLTDEELFHLGMDGMKLSIIRHLFGPRPQENQS